jgi:hypothetical protein
LGLVLVTACSFRTNGGASAPDGTVPDARQADAAIDAPVAIDAAPLCPGNYALVAGAPPTSKYRLFSYDADEGGTVSWTEAKQTCATDGTHLIIVDTAAEASAIAMQLHFAPQSPFFWEGVTDQAHEDMWKTVLGGDATYLPWGSMQPSGSTQQNCVLVGTDGLLYDFECNGVAPFACECD